MSRRKPYEFQEPSAKSPRVWRSLEEKDADPSALAAAAEAERPDGVGGGGGFLDVRSVVSRRSFMQVSAMTAAAVGVEGCVRRPVENILPYSRGPEYLQPGIPLHFATATSRGNDALGLLVTSHEGRPTKADGNTAQPSSGGASDIFAQQSVLDVYDLDRSRTPAKRNGRALADETIAAFDAAFAALIEGHVASNGRGLRFLVQPTTSATFARLRGAVAARLPLARFHTYSSVSDANIIEGSRLAFGRPVRALYDYDRANVILTLDADVLGTETGATRASSGFGQRRRISGPDVAMNRLYSVEAGHTITGASADHRLRLPSTQVEGYLKALAQKLVTSHGIDAGTLGAALTGAAPAGVPAEWIDTVAQDLATSRGGSILVAGRKQPARVHALVHALNIGLGNLGSTVTYVPAVDETEISHLVDLKALVDDASTETLVILGGNPVYDAPSDIDLAGLLARPNVTSVHLASHRDETSQACTWHCPLTHELESWGDLRGIDGTLSIQQPLMESLWYSRSAIELLGVAAGVRNWRGHYLVRDTIRAGMMSVALFERDWRRVLHAGVVPNTAFAALTDISLNLAAIGAALQGATATAAPSERALEVEFVPCAKLLDGRYANNLWALELPDPMTRLVWDNAALVSKATRNALNLRNGDMVRLKVGGKQVELPVLALPGIADNCITVALGWGRTAAGRYGNGKGFDVQPLRTSTAFDFVAAVQLEKLNSHYDLVQTQEHDRMEGRPLAIDATIEEYRAEPDFASYRAVEFNNGPLWTEQSYANGHKWGMVIDLSACTGCNACVIACQAENNIPTVGKREVARGREMYWMRIDRYFVGDSDADPQVALQPIGCQHCEEAPCENVCPVNATAHSPEGLNDMAYNRCVGTRYCANNCPYKVRRFNYLDWHTQMDEYEQATSNVNHLFAPPHTLRMYGDFSPIKQMQFNPNVTVRMRGVIEKCSYCVQRIQEAKIASRREHRPIGPNEVVSACQSACAPGAIVFGDLNNAESNVARLAQLDRRYKLLAEVGTQPRTTFLAKIRNPNPAMSGAHHAGAEEAHQ